jgi:hypothetical protein
MTMTPVRHRVRDSLKKCGTDFFSIVNIDVWTQTLELSDFVSIQVGTVSWSPWMVEDLRENGRKNSGVPQVPFR